MSVVVIILIQVEVGKAEAAQKHIEKIGEVKSCYMVTGPYDVIAYAELAAKSGFRKLVESIHDAPGVTRTETCMAI
ncbi:MAG: Lrp/AsnC ligand binding domain-containing protein [Candidatus Thorarchaeota archaeon]